MSSFKPTEIIDVSAGLIRFGPRHHRHAPTTAPLSFTDVIVKSSNVGAIKVGLTRRRRAHGPLRPPLRLRPADLAGLPRREPGHRVGSAKLNDSALASVSMGYQIGVTPLQMAAAASVVANGGTLFEPHVVRAVTRDGVRIGGEAEGRAHGDPAGDRGDADRRSWRQVVERRHRQAREGWSATPSPARPARPTSWSTAATRHRSRTCRSSASCRRAPRA